MSVESADAQTIIVSRCRWRGACEYVRTAEVSYKSYKSICHRYHFPWQAFWHLAVVSHVISYFLRKLNRWTVYQITASHSLLLEEGSLLARLWSDFDLKSITDPIHALSLVVDLPTEVLILFFSKNCYSKRILSPSILVVSFLSSFLSFKSWPTQHRSVPSQRSRKYL